MRSATFRPPHRRCWRAMTAAPSIMRCSTAGLSRLYAAQVITRLALTDFRNYAAALIEPGPGFVLLSGDNGAGKTNVLEAVSLLTPGRGLRGAALSEAARSDGPGNFAVSAR